jgi:hypothetical protein
MPYASFLALLKIPLPDFIDDAQQPPPKRVNLSHSPITQSTSPESSELEAAMIQQRARALAAREEYDRPAGINEELLRVLGNELKRDSPQVRFLQPVL